MTVRRFYSRATDPEGSVLSDPWRAAYAGSEQRVEEITLAYGVLARAGQGSLADVRKLYESTALVDLRILSSPLGTWQRAFRDLRTPKGKAGTRPIVEWVNPQHSGVSVWKASDEQAHTQHYRALPSIVERIERLMDRWERRLWAPGASLSSMATYLSELESLHVTTQGRTDLPADLAAQEAKTTEAYRAWATAVNDGPRTAYYD